MHFILKYTHYKNNVRQSFNAGEYLEIIFYFKQMAVPME